MNVEKIVPCKEDSKRRIAKSATVREVLATMRGVVFAGKDELEAALSSPEKAIELLLAEQESDYYPAILFCADVHLHENGSEYVSALCLKNRSTLVTEKYWLDDPALPSFTLALAE